MWRTTTGVKSKSWLNDWLSQVLQSSRHCGWLSGQLPQKSERSFSRQKWLDNHIPYVYYILYYSIIYYYTYTLLIKQRVKLRGTEHWGRFSRFRFQKNDTITRKCQRLFFGCCQIRGRSSSGFPCVVTYYVPYHYNSYCLTVVMVTIKLPHAACGNI